MGKLWRRIYFLLHRRRIERELAEEMESHRAMMPASRQTDFGNLIRLREESREVWLWTWLEQLWQDLSYGARVLWHAPAFTLGAAAVLALGVGANLSEFQIFDAIINRVNLRDAKSFLQFTRYSRQGPRLGFPSGAVELYRSQTHSFEWLLSEDTSFPVRLEADSGLKSNFVSADYFSSLGIAAAWGRLPDASDSQPGAPPVAALGYVYWQTHWGADPHVVGRLVHVNDKPVLIIGVLPYSFDGLSPKRTAVWLPAVLRPILTADTTPIQQDFSRSSTELFGKLKPGVPQAVGEGEIGALTSELIRTQAKNFRPDERVQVQPLEPSFLRRFQQMPSIAIFIVMVLLILLSACANLGNMLLARGLVRQREISIRIAVGASRGRIVRQLMTENLLLSFLGALAGLVFGVAATRFLLTALDAPPDVHVTVGWPILLTVFVLTVFSAIVFGLPAALQTVLRMQRSTWLRQVLVGVQVAVSCLLLVASAVLAHNGILAASIDLAFDYRNMLVADPQFYARKLPPSAVWHELEALSTRLSAIPGVQGVTVVEIPPMGGRKAIDSVPGLPHIYRNMVAPSYFAVMNLPLVRGRTFRPGETNAVIVSESTARAAWPNEDPVGKVWKLAGEDRIVTGIVKDSGANLLADAESVEAYVPIRDADVDRSMLIIHAPGDQAQLARLIVLTAGRASQLGSVTPLSQFRDNLVESMHKMITLIGSLGAIASALAGAGMFALVAFAVAQRKRELGIRIAIGARPRHILGVLLSQNLRPTIAGAVAGVILAVVLSSIVRSIVFWPVPGTVDIPGFAAGLLCFLLIATLASLSPALRALRINPSETLREE